MSSNNLRHAFILGCERSGSTWLSNVLDAHLDVEFFMEPFADYAGLFPGFADRNLHMEHCSDSILHILMKGYDDLLAHKYPLFYGRGKNLYWKNIDCFIIKLHAFIGHLQHFNISERAKQYQLLNLNLANVPIKWQGRKNKTASLTITKELRLNFKVGLLHKAFPQAKFIVIVRHPGAQVTSILKLFQRGNLGELKRSLNLLYPYLSTSNYFNKYSNYYKCLDSEHNLHEKLLLWWLINYESLIGDCKRHGVDYKVVYHEELSESPEKEFYKIFTFLGLDYSADVKSYITQSTVGADHIKRTDVTSPVNTMRDSSKHSKESIANLDDKMRRSIALLYKNFNVCEELRRYQEDELNVL